MDLITFLVLSAVVVIVVIFWKAFLSDDAVEVRNWIRSRMRPKVYRCTMNGVVGIVRAKDYDRVARVFWRGVRRKKRGERRSYSDAPRFVIQPTFLFSSLPKTERSRLIGDGHFDLEMFCVGCRVEEREFYVPPHDGKHPIARGHGLDSRSEVNSWELNDRLFRFEDAYRYVHGLPFPRPGLKISTDGDGRGFEVSRPLV